MNKCKDLIGYIVFFLGIVLAAYVGGWLMFIKPIMACAYAIDAGAITAARIAVTIIKCIFAGSVSYFIVFVTALIARELWRYNKPDI